MPGTTITIKTKESSSIEQSHLLLVEGMDDANFFAALLKDLNLNDIEIWPIGIGRNFKVRLGTLRKLSGFARVKSIGVIRDADDNPSSAFESVCQALKDNELYAPDSYGCRSTGTPVTSILILPDGMSSKGMLESLCLRAIKDDPVMSCIDGYFDCIYRCGIDQREVVKDKAKIHVYLASQNEPDKRLGESAQANYWKGKFYNEVFDNVKRFLFEIGNT
ncbi:DUF3226 domain-containing protein [Methanocrinis sp.]|uniref:DUF3226 domain-containing protein n=1 Tax=Methanocrinis sp. TaxID=3101522 RepID=UPI003D12D172